MEKLHAFLIVSTSVVSQNIAQRKTLSNSDQSRRYDWSSIGIVSGEKRVRENEDAKGTYALSVKMDWDHLYGDRSCQYQFRSTASLATLGIITRTFCSTTVCFYDG